MASALETELADLTAQMERLNSVKDPKDAAKEILLYTEEHVKSDYLAGLNDYVNPWIPDKEQKKKKKLRG